MTKVIIKEKEYSLKDIEKVYGQIFTTAKSIKEDLITQYPDWQTNEDTRFLFLDFVKEGNIYLNLLNQIISEVGTEEWSSIENHKRFNIEAENAIKAQESIANWVCTAYINRTFVDLEMTIRILTKMVCPQEEKTSITSTVNNLITFCGVSEEYKKIFKVFANIRNCTHFGGIYTFSVNGDSINYLGRNFDFIYNEPPSFLFPEDISYIITQNLEMYKAIISSPNLNGISHIPHIYTNFQYELEN